MKSWKTLESKVAFKDPFMTIRKDRVQTPDGKEIGWVYIDNSDGVVVIPITPEGKFVTIKQFRYTVKEFVFEFPAGAVHEGETPEQTAKRELEEEAGYIADELTKIGEVYEAYSQSNRKMHIFLAKVSKKIEQKLDHDNGEFEDIEISLKTKDEVFSGMASDVTSSVFHSAMFFLKEKMDKGEIEL